MAIGQRSFSLSETKLPCDAQSSITQMFFVFAVGYNHATTTKKRSLGLLQAFPHKKNDACNQYTLYFKLCVEHHPRSAQPLRTTHTKQCRARPRGKKQTCASSYLAIAVVFALQRMLELFHLFGRPSNTCKCLDGVLGSQEACRGPPKPPAGDEEMDIHA